MWCPEAKCRDPFGKQHLMPLDQLCGVARGKHQRVERRSCPGSSDPSPETAVEEQGSTAGSFEDVPQVLVTPGEQLSSSFSKTLAPWTRLEGIHQMR